MKLERNTLVCTSHPIVYDRDGTALRARLGDVYIVLGWQQVADYRYPYLSAVEVQLLSPALRQVWQYLHNIEAVR